MSVEYLLGPAASGKTHTCIDRVRATLDEHRLATVWVVVPDRTKAISFRRRLAAQGGALGSSIGTFPDYYREILARAGEFLPLAPEPVVHRMVRSAIDSLYAAGELPYYAPIRRTPGFIRAMADHIGELQRAMVPAENLASVLAQGAPRLREMASIYRRYQDGMRSQGWVDREGSGWLAVQVLGDQVELLRSIDLVIVDGFDSFSPLQLETLALLGDRVGHLLITLSGGPEMDRPAFRRFERTHKMLLERFGATPVLQKPDDTRPEVLRHLESSLFSKTPAVVDGRGRVTLIEAQTQALEVREAMRWLKARIQRGGESPAHCAIIAADLRPYQAHIREVAREFELPVRFVLGEALESNPAVTSVMNLVQLPLLDWPRRLLLNVISSPYFDLQACGFIQDDAWRLDEVAQAAQVIRGLAQWQEGLALLTTAAAPLAEDEELSPLRPPHGPEAHRLSRAIEELANRLRPRGEATLGEHARWLKDLLSDVDGFGLERQVRQGSERAERDFAALETLRQQIDALVMSERALPDPSPLTFREFVEEVRGAVEAASYQPDADRAWHGSRIYASDLAQARGVPFHAVALLGMAEGLFPAPIKEDPFLTDSERESLREAGLALEPRLRSDQQTLFYEAVTRAEGHLLLTRPYLSAEGEAWEPSPFWQAVRALVRVEPQRVRVEAPLALHDAASRSELIAQALLRDSLPEEFGELGGEWRDALRARTLLQARLAHEAEGEFEGRLANLAPLLREVYGPQHLFSPGRLEVYAGCKYHFLVQKVLGLEERAQPQEGFDPAQLGTMLHEILERIYADAPDPSDLSAILESLEPTAERVFADAPRRLGFRPSPLWEAERAALVEDLRLTLHALHEFAEGYHPVRLEAAFGMGNAPLRLQTEAGEILLHGIIDRVDVDAQGFVRVIDYKTGAGRLDMKNLQQGRRLQITLYGLAAEEVLGLGRLADGVYWKIRQAEASSLRLAELDFTSDEGRSYLGVRGAADLARMYVGRYVSGIREGDFRPEPPEGGCPRYCPARLFCWRYEPI